MKISSVYEIENDLIIREHHDSLWSFLRLTYAAFKKDQLEIDPDEIFNNFIVVPKADYVTYLGMLKPKVDYLGALECAMICVGGWKGFAGGGTSFVDDTGSIFIKLRQCKQEATEE